MAGIRTRPNTQYIHPAWAKDYFSREHVMPGGARLDAAQFVADNPVSVSINQGATANEVELVTLTNTPTGGTFTLSYNGATTPPLPYNETAANVQVALRALSTIGGANVTVTGSAGGPYTVTFIGTLAATDVSPLVGTGASLTGAGAQPGVTVATTTAGNAGEIAAGATSLIVDATSGIIPAGMLLLFGGGQVAYTNTITAAGVTAIPVEPLAFAIPDNAIAYYRGTGWVTVRDGTIVGRTYAERDAGVGYGPVSDSDDEIYPIVFTVDDARLDADVDLYRKGGIIDETHLPNWAGLSATIKAYLRANYQCTVGAE